jgi:hypothetical protein
MRAEDLVFWLDQLNVVAPSEGGVLCRRHADSMVVPRNWTLDDLRDPDLHLFRPPAAVEQPRQRSRRAHGSESRKAEQLALGVEPVIDPEIVPEVTSGTIVDEPPAEVPAEDPASDLSTENDPVAEPIAGDIDGAEQREVWSPNFDTADDLGGLLSASSPLLARAFRGAERPRESPGSN